MTTMKWSIKQSFRDYVALLDDGSEDVIEPARVDQGGLKLIFPLDSETTGIGELRFGGGVEYTGYGGILSARMLDPWIESSVKGTVISVIAGPRSVAARTAIAEIDPLGELSGEVTRVPRLTLEGARLFGDVYQPGTSLDPIILIM